MENHVIGIKYFPLSVRGFWENVFQGKEAIEEIRIRAEKPVLLRTGSGEWYVNRQGRWIQRLQEAYTMEFGEIQALVDYWCKDSRYAFQPEFRKGFLTISGGHRIGICGEAVTDPEGRIQTLKNISSLNIRLARDCKYAGEGMISQIYEEDRLQNTLLVSPPGGGKTTLLRDLVRRLSNGEDGRKGLTVGLVDERGELAASYRGIPQLDVGMRTDVMDGCLKEEGMLCLLRSMAPQVIAVDEIGSTKEVKALLKMAGCGCSILATVHGNNLEEIRKRRFLTRVWKEGIFTRVILLEKRDGRFISRLYKEEDWSG